MGISPINFSSESREKPGRSYQALLLYNYMWRGSFLRSDERGFTLMEIVIGLVIGAIVLLAGTKILVDAGKLPLKVTTETSAKFTRDQIYKVLTTDENAFINTIDRNAYDTAAPIDALKCMGYQNPSSGNCVTEKADAQFPVAIRVYTKGGILVYDSRAAGSPGMPAACGSGRCGYTRNGQLCNYDDNTTNACTWRPQVELDLDCVGASADNCVNSNVIINVRFEQNAAKFDPNIDYALNISKYDTDIFRSMPKRQGCFHPGLNLVGQFCTVDYIPPSTGTGGSASGSGGTSTGSSTGIASTTGGGGFPTPSCGAFAAYRCNPTTLTYELATSGGGGTGPGAGSGSGSGSGTAAGTGSTGPGTVATGMMGPGGTGTFATGALPSATTTVTGMVSPSGHGSGHVADADGFGPGGSGTVMGSGSTTGTSGGTAGCQATVGWTGVDLTSCFVAGTLIDTPFGPKPIEKLVPGEIVLSMSSGGRIEEKVVTEFFRHIGNAYRKITLDSGVEIKVTEEHPIYVSNYADYVKAGELQVGQLVLYSDAKGELRNQTIQSIEDVKTVEPVYNISVDENHNYFAQGILVHNKVTNWCVQDCMFYIMDSTADGSTCNTSGGTTTTGTSGTGSGSTSGTGGPMMGSGMSFD